MDKRKKIFFVILVMACIGIYSSNKKKYADNILTNIEALASGEESSNEACLGTADVYCSGMRVEYTGGLR
ncbi:MAG: NVEALA domain-containing protein [Tannerellaceae bacterium]|nr:NVEALA domain-containing protein [Tannerellaceae bacterium]